MNPNAPPDINPIDYGTLAGTLQYAFKKMMQSVDTMLPAMVINFDRTVFPHVVQVQPLIKMLDTSGNFISRAQIVSLPVQELGGGDLTSGVVLSFNLRPGNLGFIKACDNDISLFLQSLTENPPNTLRTRNFADAVFVPSILGNYVFNSEDENNCVLQSLDGTVRLSFFSDHIKITAPAGLEINGDLTVDQQLIVNGDAIFNGTGPYGATVTGNFRVDGNITAGGTITPNVPP
jgi:hypothetical protein